MSRGMIARVSIIALAASRKPELLQTDTDSYSADRLINPVSCPSLTMYGFISLLGSEHIFTYPNVLFILAS